MTSPAEQSPAEPEHDLVKSLCTVALWPLAMACTAIDAAHTEQGRHLPQPGALPLDLT